MKENDINTKMVSKLMKKVQLILPVCGGSI